MPPTLSSITASFFISLINRLGVRPPPPDAFLLSNVVVPVSVVDSDISIPALATSQLLDGASSTGIQLAPAANTVLADTGALTAGNYQLQVLISCTEVVNTPVVAIQRRDAANAANVWEHRFLGSASANGVVPLNVQLSIRVVLLANERVRVLILSVGGAASQYMSNIWTVAS